MCMYIHVDGSEKCLHTVRNEILNVSSKSFVDLQFGRNFIKNSFANTKFQFIDS